MHGGIYVREKREERREREREKEKRRKRGGAGARDSGRGTFLVTSNGSFHAQPAVNPDVHHSRRSFAGAELFCRAAARRFARQGGRARRGGEAVRAGIRPV